MRLHNYMVCSQCTRVPPHNSHALFLAYLFPWSLYHPVFDYATCFRTGQMKPSRQRLQHKTWLTSHLSTHPFGDTARSPCGIARTDRSKRPSRSLGSLYCGWESHSTPQSHPACQQCWECKAIKVDGGKTWKGGYLLSWKQCSPLHHCMLFQSLGVKKC